MTAIGKGNVPGAIFNATLSSLLGIFLTPLIVSLALQTSGGEGLSLVDTMLDIAVLLFLPFIVGQALRALVGDWFARYKAYINTFDKLVILVIVFSSFCNSVHGGLWTSYGFGTIAMAMLGAGGLLLVVLAAGTFAVRRFGFSHADEVAAVFCGSKKTLASGVPMAQLIFGANPALGVIVLPIMFYHPIQLFVCSILADRYAQRARGTAPGIAAQGAMEHVPVNA
jgi:sodium/bile acid cotransporter 7